ncbi:TerC family protein [Lawsonella clevelandensis]|uniref:TerC family protein n=1 Tax=Lawsonella clevelandensis TaxID=1528099 RepID=UPI0009E87C78|nr:TerC family protein [Lawsonella clevelandensis]
MDVNALMWIISVVVIIGLFIFDFYSHVKTPHVPSLKEAALWSLFYIVVACIFGGFLWWYWREPGNPHQHGMEFFAGYVTEKSLSVDNLFVFSLILGSFRVPAKYQQKVLLIGIAIALALRAIFIGMGAAAINTWAWVFYLFGLFLFYTAIKLVVEEIKDEEPKQVSEHASVKFAPRFFHVSHELHGDRIMFRRGGKVVFTPLFIALVAIGFTDVLFALDSIPAIYGLTKEPYIVFMTNALALLGLRQLYFLLHGLLDRLSLLSYGLSIILGFIGIKLVLHALHENKVPFINNGEPVHVWQPSITFSLLFILGVLVVTVVASVIKNAVDKRRGTHDPETLIEEEKGQLAAMEAEAAAHALPDVGYDDDEPLLPHPHLRRHNKKSATD